ncbi:MAG: endolytic transglycosylase MltG [Deltaproteobacteria bacterium]|nr:endolytic transglycosylase MltG [Deltaproteobacteria bacterium]
MIKRKTIEKIFLLTTTIAILLVMHLHKLMYLPADPAGAPVIVMIERGDAFSTITQRLFKKGVINDKKGFKLAGLIKGAHSKLKVGAYDLSSSMTPVEILNVLVSGKTKKHRVTFPEGYTIWDMAALLLNKKLLDEQGSKKFINLAMDPIFSKGLGVEGGTLEGFLFPDTYDFNYGVSVEEILRILVSRFNEIYDKELRYLELPRGFTIGDIVTLASIVQKETGVVEEMALISSVFHNRLLKGYRLQSDPTIIYGIMRIREFNGNLTRKDLKEKTAYNTYVIYGLPPGPVANPGKDALIAAYRPANENYLYFVSKNDGTHKFSKNLAEHNKAVRFYQKEYFRK